MGRTWLEWAMSRGTDLVGVGNGQGTDLVGVGNGQGD